MNLGLQVKKIRMLRGLTQKQLGELAGLSQTVVWEIENGRRVTRTGIKGKQTFATTAILSLCRALNIPHTLLVLMASAEDVPEDLLTAARHNVLFPEIIKLVLQIIGLEYKDYIKL